jgi:hypothetical protein
LDQDTDGGLARLEQNGQKSDDTTRYSADRHRFLRFPASGSGEPLSGVRGPKLLGARARAAGPTTPDATVGWNCRRLHRARRIIGTRGSGETVISAKTPSASG